jgi:hypothetical protein
MQVTIASSLLAASVEQLTHGQRTLVTQKGYFKQPLLTGRFDVDGEVVTRIGDIEPRPLYRALIDLIAHRRENVKAGVQPTYADLQIASLISRLPFGAKMLVPHMAGMEKLAFAARGNVIVVAPTWGGIRLTVVGKAAPGVKKAMCHEMHHALSEQVLVD